MLLLVMNKKCNNIKTELFGGCAIKRKKLISQAPDKKLQRHSFGKTFIKVFSYKLL